jgi:hypothetical protein
MSFSEKFNEKADELKAKARAALIEALDDKDKPHGDTEQSPSAAPGHDTRGETGTDPAAARTGHQADRANTDGSVTPPDTSRDTAGAGGSGPPDHAADQRRAPIQDTGTARDADNSSNPTAQSPHASTAGTGTVEHSRLTGDEHQHSSTRHPESETHRAAEATHTGQSSVDVTTDERLFSDHRTRVYTERWNTVQGEFVDDPRRAISEADQLVGDVLDELKTLFSEQRRHLDQGMDAERASTEDLRIALGRYRELFDRLLAL